MRSPTPTALAATATGAACYPLGIIALLAGISWGGLIFLGIAPAALVVFREEIK